MRRFKFLGSRESARQLWENEEALHKYLAKLKELMEADKATSDEKPNNEKNLEECDTNGLNSNSSAK